MQGNWSSIIINFHTPPSLSQIENKPDWFGSMISKFLKNISGLLYNMFRAEMKYLSSINGFGIIVNGPYYVNKPIY